MNDRKLSDSPKVEQRPNISQPHNNSSSNKETLFSKDKRRIAHTSTQCRNQPGNLIAGKNTSWNSSDN